jgi:hypothetical protein
MRYVIHSLDTAMFAVVGFGVQHQRGMAVAAAVGLATGLVLLGAGLVGTVRARRAA